MQNIKRQTTKTIYFSADGTNDRIKDQNSNPFIGRGIDVDYPTTGSRPNPTASQVLGIFPGVTAIRIAIDHTTFMNMKAGLQATPQVVDSWLSAFVSGTPASTLLIIEDHMLPDGSGSTLLSSQDQATQKAVYQGLAKAFLNYSNVAFASFNEPSGSDPVVSSVAQMLNCYSGVRASSTTLFFFNLIGGYWYEDNGSYPMSSSSFSGLNNVAWDLHYYPGNLSFVIGKTGGSVSS